MTIDKKAEELFAQLIAIQAPMPDDMTLEAIERQGIETRAMRINHLASALRQNLESAADRFRDVACPLVEAAKHRPSLKVPESCEQCKKTIGFGFIAGYCTEVEAIFGEEA